MNKITIILISLLTLTYSSAFTQVLDWQERKKAAKAIDQLIADYINTVELAELGKKEYSTKQETAFIQLFDENAIIEDVVGLEGKLKLETYLNDLKERYQEGFSVKILKIQADYSKLNDREAKIYMLRRFSAKKESGGFTRTDQDIILGVSIDENLEKALITYIEIPPPIPPIAEDDNYELERGVKEMQLNIRGNDENIDANTKYTKVSEPTLGKISLVESGQSCIYTVKAGTTGEDSFIYKVCKGKVCDEATVRISIPGDDEDIVVKAKDDNLSVKGIEAATIDVAANDKYSKKTVVYTIIAQPKKGKVENDGSKFTYTAKKGQTGKDTFTYRACIDGECSDAKVNITLKGDIVNRTDKTGLAITPLVFAGMSNGNADNIQWGYNDLTGGGDYANVSSTGGISYGLGLELDYYFHNNIGIGTGIQYNRIGGEYNINDFAVKYSSTFYDETVNGWSYERAITAESPLVETFTINNIGIPLLLKLRMDFGDNKKIGAFINAGILYNLSSSASGSVSGAANYEATYFSNDGTNNSYTDEGDAESDYNLELTETASNAEHLNEHYANDILNVGTNVSIGNENNTSTLSSHIALLGRLGLMYNMSENMSLLIGVQYTGGTLVAEDSYMLLDKITGEYGNHYGEYNSLLNGGATYSAMGLNLGLSYRLSGKSKKK